MMTATNTRKEARESLTGKWGKAVLIVFVYGLISFLIQVILEYSEDSEGLLYNIVSITQFIITVPISYGIIIAFMKLKRGEEVETFDFLKLGFSNFKKSWSIAWNRFLVMIVPALIIFAIVFALSFYSVVSSGLMSTSYSVKYASTNNLAILIIALIAIIACLVWSMVKRYSVELAEYISYDEPEISGKEAVKKSQEMMQGNKGNLFVLEISFIGWSILAVLTFGIGFLWLAPYIQVSKTCFYEELKNKNV